MIDHVDYFHIKRYVPLLDELITFSDQKGSVTRRRVDPFEGYFKYLLSHHYFNLSPTVEDEPFVAEMQQNPQMSVETDPKELLHL